MQQEMFGRGVYKQVQVAAKAGQVTEDKVRRVVEVAGVALETVYDFVKKDVGPDGGGHAPEADPVVTEGRG